MLASLNRRRQDMLSSGLIGRSGKSSRAVIDELGQWAELSEIE